MKKSCSDEEIRQKSFFPNKTKHDFLHKSCLASVNKWRKHDSCTILTRFQHDLLQIIFLWDRSTFVENFYFGNCFTTSMKTGNLLLGRYEEKNSSKGVH